ncbi:MAG: hypothetical protein ABFS18_02085 [Thermodesulfobacteriota bacterium]
MKKISVFLLALMVLGILGGCGLTGQQASVCESIPAGDSYLCDIATKTGVQLETIGNSLIVANRAAILKGSYTADQASTVLLDIRNGLDDPISYLFVQEAIQKAAAKHPGLFVVAGIYLKRFSNEQLISNVDANLLRSWLDRQIAMLEIL